MSLPVELVREIIEEAARTSKLDALSLLVVSSSTKRWVEPILFSTVLIRTGHQIFSLKNSLEKESTRHCASYIRRLRVMVMGRVPTDDLCGLLRICLHLEHLALMVPLDAPKQPGLQCTIKERVKHISIFPKLPPHFTPTFTFPVHQFSHLHAICPQFAFYLMLGSVDESEPSALESLVIEILRCPTYDSPRGIPSMDALAYGALSELSSCQAILRFLRNAINLKEILFRFHTHASRHRGLATCLTQLSKDPRVKVIQVPPDQIVVQTGSKKEAMHRGWLDRTSKAFDDVVEYWTKG